MRNRQPPCCVRDKRQRSSRPCVLLFTSFILGHDSPFLQKEIAMLSYFHFVHMFLFVTPKLVFPNTLKVNAHYTVNSDVLCRLGYWGGGAGMKTLGFSIMDVFPHHYHVIWTPSPSSFLLDSSEDFNFLLLFIIHSSYID